MSIFGLPMGGALIHLLPKFIISFSQSLSSQTKMVYFRFATLAILQVDLLVGFVTDPLFHFCCKCIMIGVVGGFPVLALYFVFAFWISVTIMATGN